MALCKLAMYFFDQAGVQVASSSSPVAFEPTLGYVEYKHVVEGSFVGGAVYCVPAFAVLPGSPSGTSYHLDQWQCRQRNRVEEEWQYTESTTFLASAATLSLFSKTRLFTVTGTTDITDIDSDFYGRVVYLKFNDALTVFDGGNLHLRGDLVTAAGDILVLISDGSDWHEVTRSRTPVTAMPTIARLSTTITVPAEPNLFTISGTGNIEDIDPDPGLSIDEGRVIYLRGDVTSALTFINTTGNLTLAGNFTMNQADVLALIRVGSGWHEISRSNH